MKTARNSKMRKLVAQVTRTAIQDVVTSMISRSGFQGFTMEQVAEEAGVAKGTLYLHFSSKEALMESVKEASFAPLRQTVTEILDSDRTPGKKIEDLVMRQFEHFNEHADLIRFLMEERRVAQLHKRRMRDNRYKEMVSKLASVLETGVKAGEFRPVDTDKVAIMLMEASIAVMVQRLWDESQGPWEDDARILIDVFKHGIDANGTG